MIDRLTHGRVPSKPHTELRGDSGALCYEHCWTRRGFDGPYTIAYHLRPPHAFAHGRPSERGWPAPASSSESVLGKRHYRTGLIDSGRAPLDARKPLLFNDDVVIGICHPSQADDVYWSNGDAEELIYVREGSGTLLSPLGSVPFGGGDYLYVPRGMPRRFALPEGEAQHWLTIETSGALMLPAQYRNECGQLRMDAPYSHRDFRRPEFSGPVDEGLRQLVVRKNGRFTDFTLPHSPLDVVGWDGTLYPFAFPILSFQPKVGAIHLPPTIHGTFAAPGALVCSFVPRPLDFHPSAIACPYPHSSVDIDEVLFYCSGDFTSRRGVEPGSVTHHPAGIPHGPHPGAYENSIGARRTEELAVMLDCARPLTAANTAAAVEDASYADSYVK